MEASERWHVGSRSAVQGGRRHAAAVRAGCVFRRMARGGATAISLASALGGCLGGTRWAAPQQASPDMVAYVLGEGSPVERDLTPSEIPVVPVRENLRPCCAFGTHLQASLGPLPVPFFSIGNIIDLDGVGPHKYDCGSFTGKGSSQKNSFTKENNGLVYTCRGGFVDTAHVRDYADWTIFWATAIGRASETGGTIELPAEGGNRRVIVRPVPRDLIDRYGLRRVVIVLAQWTAFQLSIWHELATAYGWAAIQMYPEYVSAFSPEDLYSNLLGVKLAGGILLRRGAAATDALYDQAMDAWLRQALVYLKPVSVEAGQEATRLVDKVWWDSEKRLPDPRLVLRRNSDLGDDIAPWLISRAYSSPGMQAWIDRECGGTLQPVVLRAPQAPPGVKFSDFVTIEIDVDVPDGFPFPRAGSKTITQDDFPGIIAAARERAVQVLGPNANRPERDPQ